MNQQVYITPRSLRGICSSSEEIKFGRDANPQRFLHLLLLKSSSTVRNIFKLIDSGIIIYLKSRMNRIFYNFCYSLALLKIIFLILTSTCSCEDHVYSVGTESPSHICRRECVKYILLKKHSTLFKPYEHTDICTGTGK